MGGGARQVAVRVHELDLLVDAYDKRYLRVALSKSEIETLGSYRPTAQMPTLRANPEPDR